jgi:hypothetical protein
MRTDSRIPAGSRVNTWQRGFEKGAEVAEARSGKVRRSGAMLPGCGLRVAGQVPIGGHESPGAREIRKRLPAITALIHHFFLGVLTGPAITGECGKPTTG